MDRRFLSGFLAAALASNSIVSDLHPAAASASQKSESRTVAIATPPPRIARPLASSQHPKLSLPRLIPAPPVMARRASHDAGIRVDGPTRVQRPVYPKRAPLDPRAMSATFRQLHGIQAPASPPSLTPPRPPGRVIQPPTGSLAPANNSVRNVTAIRRAQSVNPSSPNYTGINLWWTYESDSIPGVGKFLANVGPGGNLVIQAQDMEIPHKGVSLDFQRSYNSRSQHDYFGTDGSQASNYGAGWTNSYDTHLATNTGDPQHPEYGTGITVFAADGARYDYLPDGQGHWIAPAGQFATLTCDGTPPSYANCGNGYFWTQKSGIVYYFWKPDLGASYAGLAGRLVAIWGRNNNAHLNFGFAFVNGDPSCSCNLTDLYVTEEDGRFAHLAFTNFTIQGQPQRLLATLTWPNGTVVSYSYDQYGNLSEVDEPPNNTATGQCNGGVAQCLPQQYAYYGSGSMMYWAGGPRFVMSAIEGVPEWTGATGGGYVLFGYDGSNNFLVAGYVGWMNPTPNDFTNSPIQPGYTNGSVYKYAYLESRTASSVAYADTDGHTTQYAFDSLGRVTQTSAWNGTLYLTSTEGWDAQNNSISVTDARGNETDLAYDNNGNLIAEALPSIATSDGTFRPTSLVSYDSNGNVVSLCNPRFSHSHGLDWTSRPSASDSMCPSQMGSPSNAGSTIMLWTPTTSEPFGRLQTMTNPAGYTMSYNYDPSRQGSSVDYGLPTTILGTAFTQFDNTNVQPALNLTYDSYGQVVSRDQGLGATTITYDGIGRAIVVRDADNADSHATYYPDGSIQLKQTPAQYAANTGVSYTYDADGNRITENHNFKCNSSASCTQGVTIRWYDGADRLVEVQQPYDATDYYPFPWLTRYLYDLSQNQTVTIGNSVSINAHGNEYKQQTCVTAAIQSYSNPGSTCQWFDQRGSAFDSLDRAVSDYSYQPGGNLQVSSSIYDSSSSTLDLLSSTVNPLGESTSYVYDATGAINSKSFAPASLYPGASSSEQTPARNYVYDANGLVHSVTTAAFGTETMFYTPDGKVASVSEPAGGSGITYWPSVSFGGSLSSPATMTYSYYPNGWRSGVSVTSNLLTQSNVKQYAYRIDGLIQKRMLNALGQSFWQGLSYTPAGRLTNEGDVYNGAARSLSYDQYGQLAGLQITGASTYSGIQHDLEGKISSYTINPSLYAPYGGPTTLSNTYNIRGELLSQACGAVCASAHGFLYPPDQTDYCVEYGRFGGDTACGTQYTTFDARNGANLGTFVHFTSFDGYQNQFGRPTDAQYSTPFVYDAAARQLGAQSRGYGIISYFDLENHVVGSDAASGVRYAYGPDGNLLFSESVGSGFDYQLTHHWDGNGLLFTTDSANHVQDVLLDKAANFTPQTSYTAPTFWDRDFSGTVVSAHNASGYGGVVYNIQSIPTWYTPGLSGGSAGFAIGGPSNPNIPLLHSWRSDGYYDQNQTIQGVRSYYSDSRQWASMDAYGGDEMDPISAQPYVWNGNDPVSFEDPSGYDNGTPECPDGTCSPGESPPVAQPPTPQPPREIAHVHNKSCSGWCIVGFLAGLAPMGRIGNLLGRGGAAMAGKFAIKKGLEPTGYFLHRATQRINQGRVSARSIIRAIEKGDAYWDPSKNNYVMRDARTGTEVIITTDLKVLNVFEGNAKGTWIPIPRPYPGPP